MYKSIKIFNFDQLYIYTKLSFLNSIKNNTLSLNIFNYLYHDLDTSKNTQSFNKDIIRMQNHFNININDIFADPNYLKKIMNGRFRSEMESLILLTYV